MARKREKNNLRIKDVARAHGMTLKDVAERMGKNYVSFKQAVSYNMTIATMESIAEAIGCSPAEFFPIQDNVEPTEVNASDIHKVDSETITITIDEGSREIKIDMKDIFRVLSE